MACNFIAATSWIGLINAWGFAQFIKRFRWRYCHKSVNYRRYFYETRVEGTGYLHSLDPATVLLSKRSYAVMARLTDLVKSLQNPTGALVNTSASALEKLLVPELAYTEAGEPRRVGIEIEFADVDIHAVAALLQELFGGAVQVQGKYDIDVVDTRFGDFHVELDSSLLKRIAQERMAEESNVGIVEQVSKDLLAKVTEQVAPCEIVSPPLLLEQIEAMDELVIRLRELGAQGTDDGLLYAFGVHFNPQAPSLQAASILAYLRAFVLLYDWLVMHMQVNFTRHLTLFIKPFPSDYVKRILTPEYSQCTREQLISDYLIYNPTRNRALDMLPLFAHLDAERVAKAVDDPHVKPRPTYHYRLANSRVGDPHWRLTDEWRSWLLIEALAQDREKTAAMAAAYGRRLHQPLNNLLSNSWASEVEQWLTAA